MLQETSNRNAGVHSPKGRRSGHRPVACMAIVAALLAATAPTHAGPEPVLVKDIDPGPTAPPLAPVADHSMLWPPNHLMVTCTIQATATGNSGVPPALAVTVTSSEPDDGLGDGDTANDIQNIQVDPATGTITVDLRAERAGVGTGRIYTITITATDGEGNNSSMTSLTVLVPRSKGQGGN